MTHSSNDLVASKGLVKGVKSLVDHYGGNTSTTAKAIGVSATVLRCIMNRKSEYILRSSADRIKEAVADPPAYKPKCPRCGRGLGRSRSIYCSSACKEAAREQSWHARYVECERVAPLLDYLVKVYGNVTAVAQVLDIPKSTLEGIRVEAKDGVKKELAVKLVVAVQDLKAPKRNFFDRVYENETPARSATPEEKVLATRKVSGWN